MFSSKKIFFQSEINYNFPFNNNYFIHSIFELPIQDNNDFSFTLNDSSNECIFGIPSEEKALIFDTRDTTLPSQVLTAPLRNSDGTSTEFGKSVSIRDHLAIIGAPKYKDLEDTNDSGYVAVYIKHIDGRWLPLGNFCPGGLQVVKPRSSPFRNLNDFGDNVLILNNGLLLFAAGSSENNSDPPTKLDGYRYVIDYFDLVPCQATEVEYLDSIPFNSRIIKATEEGSWDKSFIYSNPNFSNSTSSLIGELVFSNSNSTDISFYGQSYDQLGYSIDAIDDYVLCGAPGVHPVFPSKGYVRVYQKTGNPQVTLRSSLGGINDNDGFGKAVCCFSANFSFYSLTASNNYIRCDKFYDPSSFHDVEIGIGDHILNLPQGLEVLKMQNRINSGGSFNVVFSMDGKVYLVTYDFRLDGPPPGWGTDSRRPVVRL
jgi:hypothetical protein